LSSTHTKALDKRNDGIHQALQYRPSTILFAVTEARDRITNL